MWSWRWNLAVHRNKRLSVRGVFGSSCRHQFPLKFCDMAHGERYKNHNIDNFSIIHVVFLQTLLAGLPTHGIFWRCWKRSTQKVISHCFMMLAASFQKTWPDWLHNWRKTSMFACLWCIAMLINCSVRWVSDMCFYVCKDVTHIQFLLQLEFNPRIDGSCGLWDGEGQVNCATCTAAMSQIPIYSGTFVGTAWTVC